MAAVSPADLVNFILVCYKLVDDVKINKKQAKRLMERVHSLLEPIGNLSPDSSPVLLHKMYQLLKEIEATLEKFKVKSYVQKLMNRR